MGRGGTRRRRASNSSESKSSAGWRSRATRTAQPLAFGHCARDPLCRQAQPATRRGSCERRDRARYRSTIQMGWNASGSSRRRAEGHRNCTVRRRPDDAGHGGRPDPALTACPRAHPLDRCLEGGGAPRRQGGRDLRGLPRAEVRVCRPGARCAELLAYDPQHHGARASPLRGPCGGRRGGCQQDHRRRGAVIDCSRLRGAAARHRRR